MRWYPTGITELSFKGKIMKKSFQERQDYLNAPPTRAELKEVVFLLHDVVSVQLNMRTRLIGGNPESPFITDADVLIEASEKLQAIARRLLNGGEELLIGEFAPPVDRGAEDAPPMWQQQDVKSN